MSYYESNYYENPGPAYCESDIDEPVPGWGVEPTMAGGRRVGVGAIVAAPAPPRTFMSITEEERHVKTGLPWWAWVLLLGGVGAGIGLAQNRGYLTKVGLSR